MTKTQRALNERAQLRALRKAAYALYLEGFWALAEPTLDNKEQALLWANLRDALGQRPGFNTAVSQG